MTRFFLRHLNPLAFTALVAIGIALQTSLFVSYPLLYLQPDVVLLAVLWCALKRSFIEGGILTLLFAEIAELHSGAPSGLFMIAYMGVYLGVRASSRVFVLRGLSSLVVLALAASIAWKLLNLGVLHLMGLARNQWRHTLALLFPGAVMAGATAIWVFRWLARFDWVTYKDERALQALEDELRLEGEGL